jgi:hypothetical protein
MFSVYKTLFVSQTWCNQARRFISKDINVKFMKSSRSFKMVNGWSVQVRTELARHKNVPRDNTNMYLASTLQTISHRFERRVERHLLNTNNLVL